MDRLLYYHQKTMDKSYHCNCHSGHGYHCNCHSGHGNRSRKSERTLGDKRTDSRLADSSFSVVSNLRPLYQCLRSTIFPSRVYCAMTPQWEVRDMYQEYKDMIGPNFEEDPNETGMDRVKRMWIGGLYGTSTEFEILYHVFLGSILTGYVWGSTVGNVDEVRKFKKRHNEMVFEGEYLAKRKYVDLMMVSSFKKGFLRAKAFFFFPTFFTALALTSVSYRNYVQPLDFAAAGALSGAIWKTMLGPKAQAAAALGGGFFGLILGAFTWLGFKIRGLTVPEYRHWISNRRWIQSEELSARSWSKFKEKVLSGKYDNLQNHRILFEHEDMAKFRADIEYKERLQRELESSGKAAPKVASEAKESINPSKTLTQNPVETPALTSSE